VSYTSHHRTQGKERLCVALLLLCHCVLGVYYSVTIPIWEAHDEIGHYAKVRYVATKKHLPPPGAITAPAMDETHQPPLYYLVAAVPVMTLRLKGRLVYRPNPYVAYPDAQGGHNVAIHDASAEAWPYRGDVLGVHLARWVSVLLGALVVLLVYASARALWPDRAGPRWGAALLVTAWPQFRFSTAVVNNDIAVMLAAAVTLYGMVLWLRGQDAVRSALTLGLGMGMLAIAKANGLPILVVGAFGMVLGIRRHQGRRGLLALVAVLGTLGMLSGWWYVRNVQVMGKLLGGPWNALGDLVRDLEVPALIDDGVLRGGPWLHALRTFWAAFGLNNVAYPTWVYQAALAVVIPPLLGLVSWASRPRSPTERTAVGLASLMVVAAVAVPQLLWALRSWSHVQGRYLMVGLPALALILGLGWASLGERLRVRWLPAIPLGTMIVLVSVTPLWVIKPAYAYPQVPTLDQLAACSSSRYRFGQSIELVGWRMVTPAVDRGENLQAELVWRALKPTWTSLVLSAKLRDDEGRLLTEVTRFPGNGALATDVWEPGLYLDALAMRVPESTAEQPHRTLWLDISLYPRGDPDSPLAVFQEDWKRIGRSLRLGPAKLRGRNDDLAGLPPVTYRFGDGLELRGISAELEGNRLIVKSGWRAEIGLNTDLHVSVQLRDAAGNIMAQDDGPLAGGRLPTWLWEPGDELLDRRTVRVPSAGPATLRAYLCVYELASLQRWKLWHGDSSLGSELLLGELRTRPAGFVALW